MIDEKEFEPDGWFGKRGLGGDGGRAVVKERQYIAFGPDEGLYGCATIFAADPKLRDNAGWVEWLAKYADGGYVMQKHAVPGETDDVYAQIRPNRAPVTQIEYHDHAGFEHLAGTGCPCGASRHRKAFTQRTYSDVERVAHEGGRAHAEHPELSEDRPHRHVTEGKYMMQPNRDRQVRRGTHRIYLPPKFEPRGDVLTLLVGDGQRWTSARIAKVLGLPKWSVENTRGLAQHIRRPVDHRLGGHGGEYDGGLDDEHGHIREVSYGLSVTMFDYPAHREYKDHGKRFKDGSRKRAHRKVFDQHCRRCITNRHIATEHVGSDPDPWKLHQHLRTERVNLPSTEKRLDIHPRSKKCLELGERPARVFFSIEGTPKNDALVAAGEVAFNVPSVTLWKAGDPGDGTAPELERFAREYLTESIAFIVPDSDWASNASVALQAFECREFLRGILGENRVHVAAARPKCGDVCNHIGHQRKNHKRGVDDFLGEGHTPDELLVLDRHPSDLFLGWAAGYRARHRKDMAETDIAVMEWLALHATENAVKDHPSAGYVKRSLSSILKYTGRSDQTVYNAFDRLLKEGEESADGIKYPVLETVPPGIDMKKIRKVRRAGGRILYIGEDFGDGADKAVTFRIGLPLRWAETKIPVGQMRAELGAFAAETWT